MANNSRSVESQTILSSLPEPPTFHPAKEELSDPLQYIADLDQTIRTVGVCKIVLPPDELVFSSLPEDSTYLATEQFMMNPLSTDTTFRSQDCLGEERLTTLKAIRDASRSQFEDMFSTKNTSTKTVEASFWNIIADGTAHSKKWMMAKKWPSRNDNIEESETFKCVLQRFMDRKDSFLKHHNCGLKESQCDQQYVATVFATGPVSKEHLRIGAADLVIEGGSKVWYCISKSDAENLENFYRIPRSETNYSVKQEKAHTVNENHYSSNKILLDRKATLVDNLVDSGIAVFRTVQQQGEIIVTFPGSYHFWISLGCSIGESVSYAFNKWLPNIRKETNLLSRLGKPCPLPFEEVLLKKAISVGKQLIIVAFHKVVSGETLQKTKKLPNREQTTVIREYYSYMEHLRRLQNKLQSKGCRKLKADWPYGSNPCTNCKRNCFFSFLQRMSSVHPICLECAINVSEPEKTQEVVILRRRQNLFESLAMKLWRHQLLKNPVIKKRSLPNTAVFNTKKNMKHTKDMLHFESLKLLNLALEK